MPKYLQYEKAREVILQNATVKRKARLDVAEGSFLPPHAPAFARQFFQSLRLEQHVFMRQWQFVIRWIIRSTNLGETLCKELCQEFAKLLRVDPNPRHVPESFRKRPIGPVCKHLANVHFGRVQPFSKLASAYAAYFGQTEAVAKMNLNNELRALARGAAITTGVNFPLGNFLMWSTFDEFTRSSDPFQPRPATIADLLGETGIKNGKSDFLRGETFILTIYRLPVTIKPHVPTVFEAYAGQPNYFFRPIELRGTHLPHAMPLPGYEDSHGRVEIIHGVVFANNLTARPERKGLNGKL